MGRKNAGIKTVCENRKARHDYFIHETYEAGIALQGTEVKSLRAGRANLKDSYAASRMASSSSRTSTSARTTRAISSTTIPCAAGSS